MSDDEVKKTIDDYTHRAERIATLFFPRSHPAHSNLLQCIRNELTWLDSEITMRILLKFTKSEESNVKRKRPENNEGIIS